MSPASIPPYASPPSSDEFARRIWQLEHVRDTTDYAWARHLSTSHPSGPSRWTGATPKRLVHAAVLRVHRIPTTSRRRDADGVCDGQTGTTVSARMQNMQAYRDNRSLIRLHPRPALGLESHPSVHQHPSTPGHVVPLLRHANTHQACEMLSRLRH